MWVYHLPRGSLIRSHIVPLIITICNTIVVLAKIVNQLVLYYNS